MKRSRKVIFLALLAVFLGFGIVNFDSWRISRKLAIARSALQARDSNKAINALLEAARLDSSHGEVQLLMARAYRRQGELQNVRRALEKAARNRIEKKVSGTNGTAAWQITSYVMVFFFENDPLAGALAKSPTRFD